MARFQLPEKNDDNAQALGLIYRILQRVEAEPESTKWRSLQNRVLERLTVSERGGDGNPEILIDFLREVGFVQGETKLTLPLDRDLTDLKELRAQLALTEELAPEEGGAQEGEVAVAEPAPVEQESDEGRAEGGAEGVAAVEEKDENVRVEEEEEPRRKRASRVSFGRRSSSAGRSRRGKAPPPPIFDEEEEPQEEGRAVNKVSYKAVADDEDDVEEPQGDGQVRKREVPVKQRVPYIRKVKVPVKAQKIVETEGYVDVEITKLKEVESFKDVEEKYIDMEERTEIRDREVWVKKVVREEFKRLVPVEKTRIVKARVTEVVEKAEVVRVAVPTTKIVEMDGFRIDEVEDWREEERLEWEEYTMVPRFIREYDGTKRMGHDDVEEGEEHFRHEGVDPFIEGDEELEGLPEDRAYSGGPRVMITDRDVVDLPKAKIFTVSEKPELRGTVRKRARVDDRARDEEEDEEEEGAPKRRKGSPATPAVPPSRRRDADEVEDEEDGGKEDEEDDRRLSRQPGSAVRRSARRATRIT